MRLLAQAFLLNTRRARVSMLLLAALIAYSLNSLVPGTLSGSDEHLGEFFWRNFPVSGIERRLVVVDIDEKSLAEIGPWPWSRERVAELSRRLADLGAGPQIFDIVFPDERLGDQLLAKQLARQPTVLAQIFSLDHEIPSTGHVQGGVSSPACGAPLPLAKGHIGNATALVAATGHITPRIAPDGAVRTLPALICHQGNAYPALGLAALLRASEQHPDFRLTPGVSGFDPVYWLDFPGLVGVKVPVDVRGDVRLSYRLPRQAFISVTAADVMTGRAPKELFRGALVLIGATAFGIGDAVPTPHGGAVAGVEVHAQFITALLDGRLPYTPRNALAIQWLVAFFVAIALVAIAARRARMPAAVLPLAALGLAGIIAALQGWLLLNQNLWIGWSLPSVFCLAAGLLLGAVEHARARMERELVYRNLSSYLPAKVAEEIAYHDPTGTIQASREDVVVMQMDLRNFSAYCERRPAEEAASLLHAFFATADRIVESHGGVVEEYVGDSVLARWPGFQSAPAVIAAAREVLVEGLQLLPNPPPPGLEPMAIGIGIEAGSALIGSFGPARRRTHTVLGETVTVATRLQGLTADLAYPVLIGAGAAAHIPATDLLPLGSFLLPGLTRPRELYTLANLSHEEVLP